MRGTRGTGEMPHRATMGSVFAPVAPRRNALPNSADQVDRSGAHEGDKGHWGDATPRNDGQCVCPSSTEAKARDRWGATRTALEGAAFPPRLGRGPPRLGLARGALGRLVLGRMPGICRWLYGWPRILRPPGRSAYGAHGGGVGGSAIVHETSRSRHLPEPQQCCFWKHIVLWPVSLFAWVFCPRLGCVFNARFRHSLDAWFVT